MSNPEWPAEAPIFTMVEHAAKNDTNGNPRRVFVFTELNIYPPDGERSSYYGNDGYTHIVFTCDDNYSGRRNAMEQFRKRGFAGPCVDAGRVDISPTDYKRLVKWSPDA